MPERLLLHVCCAPDATVPWPALMDEGYDVEGFFYGNNIHPMDEWIKRRDAARKLASIIGVRLIETPYEPDEWAFSIRGLEGCPEGGERCRACFALQLGTCAKYAAENAYAAICTTLTISPHKSPGLLNEIGRAAADRAGVKWVDKVWRKNDGFKKSVSLSREMGLYRQNYCGCRYSVKEEERVSNERY